jgi:predicted AAA+ superfamily ATPase
LGINELNITHFNPKIITNIGGLFESFAINEIIRLASVCDDIKNIGYWRTLGGKEIDLILEIWDGRVFAFEIKSGVNIKSSDFNSIKYYKELAGDAFAGGIVFYTGKISGTVEKDIALLPLDILWHENR